MLALLCRGMWLTTHSEVWTRRKGNFMVCRRHKNMKWNIIKIIFKISFSLVDRHSGKLTIEELPFPRRWNCADEAWNNKKAHLQQRHRVKMRKSSLCFVYVINIIIALTAWDSMKYHFEFKVPTTQLSSTTRWCEGREIIVCRHFVCSTKIYHDEREEVKQAEERNEKKSEEEKIWRQVKIVSFPSSELFLNVEWAE